MTALLMESACLVLAPSLSYPTRNGADILIDRRWAEFSHHVLYVDILGSNVLVRYHRGVRISAQQYSNHARSKLYASLRTLAKRSHYLLEKFVTKNFVHIAAELLAKPEYGMVVYSYISTAALGPLGVRESRLSCIETHNDELKWFADMRRSSHNPLVKLTAWLSKRWLLRFMRQHESDVLYLHVTKADQRGYLKYLPRHRSHIAPVGCDIKEGLSDHENINMARSIRLLFVGSLNVRMNYDGLKYFAEKFYTVIRQGVAGQLEVRIVGSNPSASVLQLCMQMGWTLYADVSEEALAESYSWADFSILPFSYATGGKLKLLKSLSQGVPFLATNAVRGQMDEIEQTCLVSDQASEWLHHITKIRATGITQGQRNGLVARAQEYSWSTIASDLYQRLAGKA